MLREWSGGWSRTKGYPIRSDSIGRFSGGRLRGCWDHASPSPPCFCLPDARTVRRRRRSSGCGFAVVLGMHVQDELWSKELVDQAGSRLVRELPLLIKAISTIAFYIGRTIYYTAGRERSCEEKEEREEAEEENGGDGALYRSIKNLFRSRVCLTRRREDGPFSLEDGSLGPFHLGLEPAGMGFATSATMNADERVPEPRVATKPPLSPVERCKSQGRMVDGRRPRGGDGWGRTWRPQQASLAAGLWGSCH